MITCSILLLFSSVVDATFHGGLAFLLESNISQATEHPIIIIISSAKVSWLQGIDLIKIACTQNVINDNIQKFSENITQLFVKQEKLIFQMFLQQCST